MVMKDPDSGYMTVLCATASSNVDRDCFYVLASYFLDSHMGIDINEVHHGLSMGDLYV